MVRVDSDPEGLQVQTRHSISLVRVRSDVNPQKTH